METKEQVELDEILETKAKIIIGDARTKLREMDSQSVNCIITSPPYWSLRKYDIPDLIWDGEEECEHEWMADLPDKILRGTDTGPRKEVFKEIHLKQGNFCQICGAWRGQLGLEPTIDLYLKHLMQIMDECKRVLRDDGTMWVNLGDSYSGSGKGIGGDRTKSKEVFTDEDICATDWSKSGILSKSLCLIPERFAIEMVNKGWILRNKIIWHKPNAMPSSVKDRFTVDFEPVFFFVKSKTYWFEQQYEDYSPKSDMEYRKTLRLGKIYRTKEPYKQNTPLAHDSPSKANPNGRNRRCVWTIPTRPYPESHFATFPEALVEPMIRAGCPEGGTVLDPFAGSGTTIKIAEKLGRNGVGIDMGYEELMLRRILDI